MSPDPLRQSHGAVTRFCGRDGYITILPAETPMGDVDLLTWLIAAEHAYAVMRATCLGTLETLQAIAARN